MIDGIAWAEGWTVEFRDGLSAKATHDDGRIRLFGRYSVPTPESVLRIDEALRADVPLRGVEVVRLE